MVVVVPILYFGHVPNELGQQQGHDLLSLSLSFSPIQFAFEVRLVTTKDLLLSCVMSPLHCEESFV